MSWCLGLVLAGVCLAQDPDELEQLKQRVSELETKLEEQGRAQEEINGLLLRALDATSERLEQFLLAVQAGGLPAPVGAQTPVQEPVQEPPAEEERDWTAVLAVGAAAVGFVLLAWLWNLRSTAVVDRLVGEGRDREGSEGVGALLGLEMDAEVEGNGETVEAVEDLDVENVGVELGLANVEAVELEDVGDVGQVRGQAPCRVQWRMACGNPAVGEKLVRELLAREPRVLVEPAPRVEAEGKGLRIGYHVHPGLPVADRTQIAARLTELLGSLGPGGHRVR